MTQTSIQKTLHKYFSFFAKLTRSIYFCTKASWGDCPILLSAAKSQIWDFKRRLNHACSLAPEEMNSEREWERNANWKSVRNWCKKRLFAYMPRPPASRLGQDHMQKEERFARYSKLYIHSAFSQEDGLIMHILQLKKWRLKIFLRPYN